MGKLSKKKRNGEIQQKKQEMGKLNKSQKWNRSATRIGPLAAGKTEKEIAEEERRRRIAEENLGGFQRWRSKQKQKQHQIGDEAGSRWRRRRRKRRRTGRDAGKLERFGDGSA
jgi:hypothetical protein